MFCKVCGAYISDSNAKCDECGAVNGETPFMRLQKAIQDNSDIPDVFNAPTDKTEQKEEKLGDINKEKSEPKNDTEPVVDNVFNDVSDSDFDFSSQFFNDDISTDTIVSEENESSLDIADVTEQSISDDIQTSDSLAIEDNEDLVQKYLNESDSKNSEIDDILSNNHELYDKYSSGTEAEIEDNSVVPIKPITQTVQGQETESEHNSNQNVDNEPSVIKINKTAPKRNKMPIIIAAVLLVIIALGFAFTQTGLKDLFTKDKTTTTSSFIPSPISTTIPTSVKPDDDLSLCTYAEIYNTDANTAVQAANSVDNGYVCGKIIKVEGVSNFVGYHLTTQEGKEVYFRMTVKDLYPKDFFIDKEMTVIGSLHTDTVISAEKIYIYDSSESPVIIEDPTTADVPTTNSTLPSVTIPTTQPTSQTTTSTTKATTRSTTKATTRATTKPTTTTTTIQAVPVRYITQKDAEKLMNTWRANAAQLGSSNAYYGPIQSVISNGKTLTIKTNSYSIEFLSRDVIGGSELADKNVLAVGKPQADGTIRASQVYIY